MAFASKGRDDESDRSVAGSADPAAGDGLVKLRLRRSVAARVVDNCPNSSPIERSWVPAGESNF